MYMPRKPQEMYKSPAIAADDGLTRLLDANQKLYQGLANKCQAAKDYLNEGFSHVTSIMPDQLYGKLPAYFRNRSNNGSRKHKAKANAGKKWYSRKDKKAKGRNKNRN